MMSLEFFSQYFSELINTSMKRGITMDKSSLTIRPDKPVTPKKEIKGITVSVDMDTDKMQLKLRAFAKHVGALADELDAIDNAWQCECGSLDYSDHAYPSGSLVTRVCDKCKESHIIDKELPTRMEGSE